MDYYILYITGSLQKTEFYSATGLPRGASKAISQFPFWSWRGNPERGKSIFKPEYFYLTYKNENGKLTFKDIPYDYEKHEHVSAVFIQKQQDAVLAKLKFLAGGFDKYCFNSKFPSILGSKWINTRKHKTGKNDPDHFSFDCYRVEDNIFDETFFLLAKRTMFSLMLKSTREMARRYNNATPTRSAKQVGLRMLVRTRSRLGNSRTRLLNNHASVEQRLCDILTEVHSSVS